MTLETKRQEYNDTFATRPNELREKQLCSWSHCDTCINVRIGSKMPIPHLKTAEGRVPYHRYLNPFLKPVGYVKKSLKTPKQ